MKTYVNIKTGNRYPEYGCDSWFMDDTKTKWDDGEQIITHNLKYHIKSGHDESTDGWKKFNPKQWKEETIPDFTGYAPTPFDHPDKAKEWKEYAAKWGVMVAMEFLSCCDMTKPDWASDIINPIENIPSWEDREWFKSIFGEDPLMFAQPLLQLFTRRFSFDILAFEKKLNSFGYDPKSDISMAQFIDDKWGEGTAKRFREMVL